MGIGAEPASLAQSSARAPGWPGQASRCHAPHGYMNPICKWSPNTPQAPTHFLALPPASTPGLTSLRPPSHMGSVTESLQRWTKIHLDLPAGVRTPRRRSMLMFPVHDFALARRTHARSSLQSVRALQCARKPGRWRIDIHTHIYIRTYICACAHTRIYICVNMYTHVWAYTYIPRLCENWW